MLLSGRWEKLRITTLCPLNRPIIIRKRKTGCWKDIQSGHGRYWGILACWDSCGCLLQFLNVSFNKKFPILTGTNTWKKKKNHSPVTRFSIWLPCLRGGWLCSLSNSEISSAFDLHPDSSFTPAFMTLPDLSQPYVNKLDLHSFSTYIPVSLISCFLLWSS